MDLNLVPKLLKSLSLTLGELHSEMMFKMHCCGVGEMIQWIRVLAALSEKLNSSTQTR